MKSGRKHVIISKVPNMLFKKHTSSTYFGIYYHSLVSNRLWQVEKNYLQRVYFKDFSVNLETQVLLSRFEDDIGKGRKMF